MSKRKYLDAKTLKQHLFAEATLGYVKTLEDVNRVIDALPEADPQEMARQLWRDAKKDPPDPNVDVMFTTDRAKNRAKTFPGIAKAMSEQWG